MKFNLIQFTSHTMIQFDANLNHDSTRTITGNYQNNVILPIIR